MNVRVLCVVAAVVFLAGCAKKEDGNILLREQAVFEAWMAENHPEAEKASNGMYFEWLRRTNDPLAPSPVSGVSWAWVDYLVRDLEGNIMATRSEDVAKEEWTYTRLTHYVPDFGKVDPSVRYFTQGEYAFLPEMKVSDSVRLYLPSTLAYRNATITFANGYEGWRYSSLNPQNQTAMGVPRGGIAVTIDLALRGVTSNPVDFELEYVEQLADNQGLNAVPNETGLYYRRTAGGGAAVSEGETAWVKWVLRFTDGKLVGTNDPEVASAEWDDNYNTYLNLDPFTAPNGSTIPGTALNAAVKQGVVNYDSSILLAFVSYYGYGDEGIGSRGLTEEDPRPRVAPYTPLMLEVTIMPEGYTPGGDLEPAE